VIKLNRLKTKLREEKFFNPYIRTILNSVYRVTVRKEAEAVKEYCNSNSPKSLVAFALSQLYSLEHVRGLVERLKDDEKMHPMLFCPTKWVPGSKLKKVELFKFLSSRYGIIYNENLFAYPWLKSSSIKLFFELSLSSYGSELKCPKVLYTHGMAGLNFSKDLQHIKFVGRYNAIFLNGPLHKKALLVAQKKYGVELPRMYEIGYLRGDRLLERQEMFNKKDFLKDMGLPDLPTVIYAPTWGDFSSTVEWIDDVVAVCGDIGVNLLLRLHPIMLTGEAAWKTGGVDWSKRLVDIEKNHSHVTVAMSHDIDDIMLAADVMITDVSGLALEFMSIDKPVVFLPAPRYFKIYGSDRPEKWCKPDYEIQSKNDLKHELNKAVRGEINLFPADKLVYNRGKTLEVMLKTVEELMI